MHYGVYLDKNLLSKLLYLPTWLIIHSNRIIIALKKYIGENDLSNITLVIKTICFPLCVFHPNRMQIGTSKNELAENTRSGF